MWLELSGANIAVKDSKVCVCKRFCIANCERLIRGLVNKRRSDESSLEWEWDPGKVWKLERHAG